MDKEPLSFSLDFLSSLRLWPAFAFTDRASRYQSRGERRDPRSLLSSPDPIATVPASVCQSLCNSRVFADALMQSV